MGFFSRFAPVVAYRDLRRFLATRERYEFGFLALALAITGFLIFAFIRDSSPPVEYHRDIIYVKNWRLDRTDAQIKAQQAIDQAARDKEDAAQRAREAKMQGEFKRLDSALTNMGI